MNILFIPFTRNIHLLNLLKGLNAEQVFDITFNASFMLLSFFCRG